MDLVAPNRAAMAALRLRISKFDLSCIDGGDLFLDYLNGSGAVKTTPSPQLS